MDENVRSRKVGPPDDAAFMRRALELAVLGSGRTNPNPLVGAVVVRDGCVIGEGFHGRYGEAHAEVNALVDCASRGEDPRGASIYVTLEPCCHHGHQPPCAEALIKAGISRVVIGSQDPNPLVAGKGAAMLRDAGIEVVEGVERAACDAVNQVFFKYIVEKRPYVVAKWGVSADGRAACASGDARWVTGELARAHGHALRNRLAAVMVGSGTLAIDDPLLTCRLEGGRTPLRVVCDSRLRIGLDSALVRSVGEGPVLVACACTGSELAGGDSSDRRAALRDAGVDVLSLPATLGGHVDLDALMTALGERGVDSILLEGGPRLHAAAFAAGIVDEAVAYVAPKVIGGMLAPGPVSGTGARRMADAIELGAPQVAVLGNDVRISWRLGATPADRARPCVSAGFLGPVWENALSGVKKEACASCLRES